MTFLIPLLLGFVFNLASAFTSAYSHRWGQKRGSMITVILRNILGIPIWTCGIGWAIVTPSPTIFTATLWTQSLGWINIVLGASIIIIALRTLHLRSAAPSIDDELANNGLYAHMRNPIHTGTILEFIGLILIVPSQTAALTCLIGIIWVFLQTAFDEFDLLQRMPGYQDYMERVPRFIPTIRLHKSRK